MNITPKTSTKKRKNRICDNTQYIIKLPTAEEIYHYIDEQIKRDKYIAEQTQLDLYKITIDFTYNRLRLIIDDLHDNELIIYEDAFNDETTVHNILELMEIFGMFSPTDGTPIGPLAPGKDPFPDSKYTSCILSYSEIPDLTINDLETFT